MNLKESCKQQYEKALKTLEKGDAVHFSTCSQWQMPIISGEDAVKYQAIPIVANKLKETYKVNCSVNHGVTDYIVYPNIEL